MVATTASSLLSLFQSFVTILVVDFAGFWGGQSFIGFGDFNELLLGCFVTSVDTV
jgi:hypothetical protein